MFYSVVAIWNAEPPQGFLQGKFNFNVLLCGGHLECRAITGYLQGYFNVLLCGGHLEYRITTGVYTRFLKATHCRDSTVSLQGYFNFTK